MSARRATAWDDWLGRQRVVEDVITGGAVNALAATLDIPRAPAQRGEPLPCCWHWLYFQQPAPASRLGADGHALRGDFLPPVNLPRRMWAGGRLQFHRPLRVGDSLRRESTIADIACKRGASGELVFVRLDHRILCGEELVLEEQQDLVFREAPRGGTSPKHQRSPQQTPQWSRSLQPDPVLLFRYSALTFNAHRIHYDRDYAVEQEGYAGLVVQGPLAATLLLQQLQSELPLVRVQRFEFRSLRPLLDTAPLTLQGRREHDAVELWVLDHQGDLAMQAHVQVSEQR